MGLVYANPAFEFEYGGTVVYPIRGGTNGICEFPIILLTGGYPNGGPYSIGFAQGT